MPCTWIDVFYFLFLRCCIHHSIVTQYFRDQLVQQGLQEKTVPLDWTYVETFLKFFLKVLNIFCKGILDQLNYSINSQEIELKKHLTYGPNFELLIIKQVYCTLISPFRLDSQLYIYTFRWHMFYVLFFSRVLKEIAVSLVKLEKMEQW